MFPRLSLAILRNGLLALLPVFALAACSRLSVENYDRLRVGMSYTEVTGILGKPDTCSDAMLVRTCRWGTDTRYASVNFVADKTVLYSAEGLR
ncbi:DUF3862 domain-containing protein [Uliginosibacterium sp. H3]|uniref:DUF3862 domain-containing protein n=1 Tax=Uliginosibacterium silvisoli TaxID=3114758 RepID=A0ABU6JZU3_9RHOO|nr:DUF3862 domain-containing protein [Uliginosibacterium sp. H3]